MLFFGRSLLSNACLLRNRLVVLRLLASCAPKSTPVSKIEIKNDKITVPEIVVIDEDGKRREGICQTKYILSELKRRNECGTILDLVLVNSDAQPPICRIFNRAVVEQKEKEKKMKLSEPQKQPGDIKDSKELRFYTSMGDHDLKMRVERILEFLEKQIPVLVAIKRRGDAKRGKEQVADEIQRMLESATVALEEKIKYTVGKFSTDTAWYTFQITPRKR